MKGYRGFGSAIISLLATTAVSGSLFAADVSSLGRELTPFGAERAGNKDGSIPAWDGGLTEPPKSYKGPGTPYVDPFPEDKPLFVINHKNYQSHKANLSEGQQQMFAQLGRNFVMQVYQTRRSYAAPQWVADNTRKNAGSARLVRRGKSIAGAYGGVPFPLPKRGVEVLWNHLARWQGSSFSETTAGVVVREGGDWHSFQYEATKVFNFYDQKGSARDLSDVLSYSLLNFSWPKKLNGSYRLVHESLNSVSAPSKVWNYLPGQKKVRPSLAPAYDQNQGYVKADEVDMFSGSPDRYNWKLLGKKELYVPYNSYTLGSKQLNYIYMLADNSIYAELARWEKHRVWVVEGELKNGKRHAYNKRRFYIDEDSWFILIAEAWDKQGELTGVSYGYPINAYDLPGFMYELIVHHDLAKKQYAVSYLDNEIASSRNYSIEKPESGFWTPANLRRLGRKQ